MTNTTAAVLINNVGDKPIAVFPKGTETRIELHPGEQATFEGEQIVVEPAMCWWRFKADESGE